eukprot:11184509-Lingulodinium_polyedra.AAC.1
METTLAQTVLSIYAYATRCGRNRRFHFSSPRGLLEGLGVKKSENDFGSNIVLYMPTRQMAGRT